jgi:hypothetical protein
VPGSRLGIGRDLDALRHIKSLYCAPLSVAFAIDPELTVIVNAGFKEHTGALNRMTMRAFRQDNREPVPGKCQTA